MIYLCSVYSLDATTDSEADQAMRNKRYEYVLMRTAEMMNKGEIVFSPTVHCHEMAIKHELPKTHAFWLKYDDAMIEKSDEVWVLCMPGYKQSKGITHELETAAKLGKPVIYLTTYDYFE